MSVALPITSPSTDASQEDATDEKVAERGSSQRYLATVISSADAPPARLRTAIAVSIVVHLCALALCALIAGTTLSAQAIVDDVRVFRLTPIEHRRPTPRPSPALRAVVRATPSPKPVPVREVVAQLPAIARPPLGRAAADMQRRRSIAALRTFVVSSRVMAAPAAPPVARSVASRSAAPNAAPAAVASAPATPAPTSAPLPDPTATAAATSAAAGGFNGLFSQNYPPAPTAPSALAALRARLSGHGRILIDVDEGGHATGVRFVGPIGAAVAQDLRAQLLGMNYLAAECNGLHCDGTLEISF